MRCIRLSGGVFYSFMGLRNVHLYLIVKADSTSFSFATGAVVRIEIRFKVIKQMERLLWIR